MSAGTPPTLYEWAGGAPALDRLMEVFYRDVRRDPVLAPLFRHMPEDHPHHVALWFGEVFGGPPAYTEQRGGFLAMRAHHVGKDIAPDQRARWAALLLASADEAGLPDDAEFRSALASYVEWGSRRAMANSRPGATLTTRTIAPRWGWGETPPGTD